jgi:hypothetical protein
MVKTNYKVLGYVILACAQKKKKKWEIITLPDVACNSSTQEVED